MIGAAFTNPVLGAQAAFRAAMQAMAQPGLIMELRDLPQAPSALPPAMAAMALALCDADTPLWHDAGANGAAWLDFHLGAPRAPLAAASFVLACHGAPALATLAMGTDDEPELGTTLILAVTALEAGTGWRLEGPGIDGHARLSVAGLPSGFVAERAALAPKLPRGIDIILCCGARLAALPRSTRITEGG